MAGRGHTKTGGRKLGTPNELPDLRAITLKALLQAGGVDYLERQAHENPGPFLGLLGRVMPREVHAELTGEVRIRQEVRHELIEKLVVLLGAASHGGHDDSITHTPALMLQAQALTERDQLSRRGQNARRESLGTIAHAVQRAHALQNGASSASDPGTDADAQGQQSDA